MNLSILSKNEAGDIFPHILLPSKKIDLNKTKEFEKTLNSVFSLYQLAIDALKELKQGHLTSLDALATDCSCHLRAFYLATTMQEIFASSSSLRKQLKLAKKDLKTKQAALIDLRLKLVVWVQKGKKTEGIDHLQEDSYKVIQTLQKQPSSFTFDLDKFLTAFNLSVELPSSLTYAIHASALTLVKSYKQVKETDKIVCPDCEKTIGDQDGIYKEATLVTGISRYAQKKFNKNELNCKLLDKDIYGLAKKHLTQASAHFIIHQIHSIGDIFTHTMLEKNKKEHEGKIELPDYYSLTAVFTACLKKNLAVMLKIKKCVHSHRYQEPSHPFEAAFFLVPDGKAFKNSFLPKENINFPVIVVEGKRSGLAAQKETTEDYLKRLMKVFDLSYFCQLDGAQHKQYTSDEDSLNQSPSQVIPLLKEKDYEQEAKKLDELKIQAQNMGCSFHNQSLLIFSHIFADTFNHQMEKEGKQLYQQTAQWIGLTENK